MGIEGIRIGWIGMEIDSSSTGKHPPTLLFLSPLNITT